MDTAGPAVVGPLPATLDRFVYARQARETLAGGTVPLDGFRADAFGSTLLTAVASSVTGVRPLYLLQPLYALIGATTVVLGFVFVRRLGREYGWSGVRVRRGSVFAGFVLAVEGIFVRRTGVPDDDAITLLLIPIAVLVLYRYVSSGRRAWLVVLAPLLVVFPLIHTFSTFVLGTTLLAFAAIVLTWGNEGRSARGRLDGVASSGVSSRAVIAGVVVAGFWAYFVAYYAVMEGTALTVPYVDRVTGHPGLFLGWLVALVVGVVWYQRTSWRVRRLVAAVPLGPFFVVVVVNAGTTVFPETVRTPRVVVLSVVPLVVPALFGAWASPLFGEQRTVGAALLALFGAPVVTVLFALSASLTPEFFATAMRAQTHLHVSVAVVGGALCAWVVSGGTWRVLGREVVVPRGVRVVVVVAFVVAVAATLPVAHVNLDTGSAPSTSLESEFAAASFSATYLDSGWTSSHTQTRIAGGYYRGANGSVGPTRQWLRGGPPPSRAVVAQASWTTTGAHLFPLAPGRISEAQYERWQDRRNVIYTSNGRDEVVIVVGAGVNGTGS